MPNQKPNDMNRSLKITYDVVTGLQYGDEGKGKIAQKLALTPGLYQMSARPNGGPNAGHTVFDKGHKIVLHVVPVGILAGLRVNFIGPGVVIDPVLFQKEVELLKTLGFDTKTIYLSHLAHVITPFERLIDGDINGTIGTTGRGIGPTYANKRHRVGLQVKDVFQWGESDMVSHILDSYGMKLLPIYHNQLGRLDAVDGMRKEWVDAVLWLKDNISFAKPDFFLSGGEASEIFKDRSEVRILVEGAQAVMLDNTFGTYPFVTSSDCLPSSAPAGLGLPGKARKGTVIGVFKAYNTRVGNGPFPTELLDGEGDSIRKAGNEYGSTTGRDRRCGE